MAKKREKKKKPSQRKRLNKKPVLDFSDLRSLFEIDPDSLNVWAGATVYGGTGSTGQVSSNAGGGHIDTC